MNLAWAGRRNCLVDVRSAFEGRYTIEAPIGANECSTSYRVRDDNAQALELHIVAPEICYRLGPPRYKREMSILQELTHQSIVRIAEVDLAGPYLYYVQPLIEADTLRARLDRRFGAMSLGDIRGIVADLAGALGHAHARGVVHRHLRPGYIVLAEPVVMVTGFAEARLEWAAGSGAGDPLADPYASPEVRQRSATVDGRADIYALAAVSYEMLSGSPPDAPIWRQDWTPERRLRHVRRGVPSTIDIALWKALAPAADDRFSTVADFASAMDAGFAAAKQRDRGVIRRAVQWVKRWGR